MATSKNLPYRGSPDYAGGLSRVDEKYLHAARLAHVRPAGQPCPEHPEYKALWAKTTQLDQPARSTTKP